MCKKMWLFCNKVNSSVNNSRAAGEEVTGRRKKGGTEILKKRKREVMVLFKREPLIIFHGPDQRLGPFYVMVIQIC